MDSERKNIKSTNREMKKEQQKFFSAAKFEKWQPKELSISESDAEIDQKFKSKFEVVVVNSVSIPLVNILI